MHCVVAGKKPLQVMLPSDDGAATAAMATAGLISDDHLELQQLENQDLTSLPIKDTTSGDEIDSVVLVEVAGASKTFPNRRRPYLILPSWCTNIITSCKLSKGSIQLAFLSHICFLLASAFYVKLSFLDLAWAWDTQYTYHVPAEVLDEDDDEVWSDWEDNNDEYGDIVDETRDAYYVRSQLFYVLGASFFVIVGMIDWIRFNFDMMNVFMILAGAAGVVSALSDTSSQESIWNCISVHLFLLEAYNLLNRDKKRNDDNEEEEDDDDEEAEKLRSFFRLGDICFLVGSILDVLVSYLDLGGLGGIWIVYTDMTGCFLWLACSLIDLAAEVYFLNR